MRRAFCGPGARKIQLEMRRRAPELRQEEKMRPLLVGQAPSRRGDPGDPFNGDSGRRLARLAGVELTVLLDALDRTNLLAGWPGSAGKGDKFPMPEARKAAARIIVSAARWPCVVLAGRRVAAAFMTPGLEPLRWRAAWWHQRVALLPHPSGVDRWYNEEANRRAARKFVRRLIGLAREVRKGSRLCSPSRREPF